MALTVLVAVLNHLSILVQMSLGIKMADFYFSLV